MNEIVGTDPGPGADSPAGPPPPEAPGPIAQSVAIGFRVIYVAASLVTLLWLATNVREIASDSQVVVRRFGRIVRSQESGLLLALPRPIETVQLLPGPERQLSHEVVALPVASEKSGAAIGTSSGAQSLPANAAPYLTGDGNVVLLNATLTYRISNPVAYALAENHVSPALDRLFRATTVRVAAGRNLNDFLVVQSGDRAGNSAAVALRSEVRDSLLQRMNERLQQLATEGAALGVDIQRIDMTAWLPPEARSAFDAVLVATQSADRGVAVARTEAERRRQEAERLSGQLLSAAQATATELVSNASVNSAGIVALEKEETPETRGTLLLREYRNNIGGIMNRVGSLTLVDPLGGVRLVLPGKQK